jgi:calcineurin-like phosphoesterase
MVGAEYSILGREVDAVLKKFTTGMPVRLPVVEKGIRLDAAIVSYDVKTGRATDIRIVSRMSSV